VDSAARPDVRRTVRRATTASTGRGSSAARSTVSKFDRGHIDQLVEQLRAIEDSRSDGVVRLDGLQLNVTNLHKVFWPSLKLTKGDLFRYYARIAPAILPVLADRPLVMKRYPNGVDAKPFYQHRAEAPPEGVRVEPVAAEDRRPQLIGGNMATLLYTVQLAAISQDPWFSRVQTPGFADQVALDLDPSDEVPFEQVLDVARWIHEELDALGVSSLAKTSGSSGLHIFIPLAPNTPFDAGLLFCQLVATLVAEKHPKHATVERSVRARGRRVYVDFLQNIQGKTLASAYSVRANDFAGVSTPLTWKEVHAGVTREDFTIRTVPSRVDKTGDLWAPIRSQKGADLRAITKAKT
jgi:bifunctional non-homologous end joining protein LigD